MTIILAIAFCIMCAATLLYTMETEQYGAAICVALIMIATFGIIRILG